jgi:hypothetical protein
VPAPSGPGWEGASYVGHRTLLAWTKDGIGYLYALPRFEKADILSFTHAGEVPKDYNVKESVNLNDEETVIYESPKLIQTNFRMSLLSKLNVVDKSSTPVLQLLCTFLTHANELVEEKSAVSTTSYIGACMGRVFLIANEEGMMKSWIIPSRPTKTTEQSIVLPWSGNFCEEDCANLHSNPCF